MSYNSDKTHTQMGGMVKVLRMTTDTTSKEMHSNLSEGKYLVNVSQDSKMSAFKLTQNASDIDLQNVADFNNGYGYMNDDKLNETSSDTEWCSNRAIYKFLSSNSIGYNTITCNVSNGTSFGSTIILKDDTATLFITSNDGYAVQPDQGGITVENAVISSYEVLQLGGGNRVSKLVIKNPTGNVTITYPCLKIYKIITTLKECSYSGDTIILATKTAKGKINPRQGFVYENVVVHNVESFTYDKNTHDLVFSNPTGEGDVEIEATYVEALRVVVNAIIVKTKKSKGPDYEYSINDVIYSRYNAPFATHVTYDTHESPWAPVKGVGKAHATTGWYRTASNLFVNHCWVDDKGTYEITHEKPPRSWSSDIATLKYDGPDRPGLQFKSEFILLPQQGSTERALISDSGEGEYHANCKSATTNTNYTLKTRQETYYTIKEVTWAEKASFKPEGAAEAKSYILDHTEPGKPIAYYKENK